jgi:hypothetical protein
LKSCNPTFFRYRCRFIPPNLTKWDPIENSLLLKKDFPPKKLIICFRQEVQDVPVSYQHFAQKTPKFFIYFRYIQLEKISHDWMVYFARSSNQKL